MTDDVVDAAQQAEGSIPFAWVANNNTYTLLNANGNLTNFIQDLNFSIDYDPVGGPQVVLIQAINPDKTTWRTIGEVSLSTSADAENWDKPFRGLPLQNPFGTFLSSAPILQMVATTGNQTVLRGEMLFTWTGENGLIS